MILRRYYDNERYGTGIVCYGMILEDLVQARFGDIVPLWHGIV
jgi:hypothetical protein